MLSASCPKLSLITRPRSSAACSLRSHTVASEALAAKSIEGEGHGQGQRLLSPPLQLTASREELISSKMAFGGQGLASLAIAEPRFRMD